jgi:hypothetical protein
MHLQESERGSTARRRAIPGRAYVALALRSTLRTANMVLGYWALEYGYEPGASWTRSVYEPLAENEPPKGLPRAAVMVVLVREWSEEPWSRTHVTRSPW